MLAVAGLIWVDRAIGVDGLLTSAALICVVRFGRAHADPSLAAGALLAALMDFSKASRSGMGPSPRFQ